MSKTEKTIKGWNNLTGRMTIFAHRFETKDGDKFFKYSTIIGKDDETLFIDLRLSKDVELPIKKNGTYKINLKKGFFGVNQYKNSDKVLVTKPTIVVQDAEIIDDDDD